MYMDKTILLAYTGERLKQGASLESIKQNLLSVGWTEEEAGEAIVAGLIASGVPVPPTGARKGNGRLSSTVEVVLNFFSFIVLVSIATSLGILFYQIINNYFVDPLALYGSGGGVDTSAVHYATAVLAIGFPIYVLSLKLWFKRFGEDEEKVESKLTKWLTYLVLLATAITIVGDLVTALFYLLQGEITARFFLKALIILVIAGIVFGFYFLERKKVQYHKNVQESIFKLFAWGVAGLVIIAVSLGFIVGGSPKTERSRGFDTQRANDLRQLANCVNNYAASQKALPDSLNDLTKSTQYAYCSTNMIDPETLIPYEYSIMMPSVQKGAVRQAEFQLCATFALDSENQPKDGAGYAYPSDKWTKHGTGHSCNTETVTFDGYPVVTGVNGVLTLPQATVPQPVFIK